MGATGTIADPQGFGDLKPIAPGRPKMAFIGVTDRCNTRCRHCPHYHYTFGTDMSEAVMRKAIDALAEGLELIAAQGVGEPLIASPFYMILEACERSGVPSIRVQPLFGNNNLDALRGQSPFEAPDVVAPASLEGMAVARELGIKLDLPPSFQSMACHRALAGDAPWLDHLTPGARLILDELLAQRATGPNPAHAGPKAGIRPCRWPWDWINIASSGVVHGCCMGGPTLGDLNSEDWEAIWNGPRFQSFRRLVHSWNPPATCRVCTRSYRRGPQEDPPRDAAHSILSGVFRTIRVSSIGHNFALVSVMVLRPLPELEALDATTSCEHLYTSSLVPRVPDISHAEAKILLSTSQRLQ